MNIHRFHPVCFFLCLWTIENAQALYRPNFSTSRGPLTDLSGIEADQAAEKCLGDAMWLDG